MFNQVASQKLREMAEQLATIGEEDGDADLVAACHFAKCLSVLMRVELARRSNGDES